MLERLSNFSRVIVFFFLSVPFHLTLWLTVQQLVMKLSQSTAVFLMPVADLAAAGAGWGRDAAGALVLKQCLHGEHIF